MSDTRTRGAAITAAAVLALAGTGAAVAVTAGTAHAQSSAGSTHRAAARAELAKLAEETRQLKADADALQKEVDAAKAAPVPPGTGARSGDPTGTRHSTAAVPPVARQRVPAQQARNNPAPTTHTTTGASGSTGSSTTKPAGDDDASGGHDD